MNQNRCAGPKHGVRRTGRSSPKAGRACGRLREAFAPWHDRMLSRRFPVRSCLSSFPDKGDIRPYAPCFGRTARRGIDGDQAGAAGEGRAADGAVFRQTEQLLSAAGAGNDNRREGRLLCVIVPAGSPEPVRCGERIAGTALFSTVKKLAAAFCLVYNNTDL